MIAARSLTLKRSAHAEAKRSRLRAALTPDHSHCTCEMRTIRVRIGEVRYPYALAHTFAKCAQVRGVARESRANCCELRIVVRDAFSQSNVLKQTDADA
jgi:hypothetical protein